MSHPLLIVGVDGLPPAFVRRLIDEGRVPNIARLAEAGSLGVLRSTPNYQSASAWTSLVTGTNPGRHGIIHFTNPVRGSYQFEQIDARARRAPTVWRILSDAGVSVAALNLPVSYPVEQVRGVMIAGWLCPSAAADGFAHPPDLAGWIRDEIGDYPIHPDLRRHATSGDYATVAAVARRGIDVKLDVAGRVVQRRGPDVLCVVVTETDSLQHWCWHLLDPDHPEHHAERADRRRDELLSVYVTLDEALGRLLSIFDERPDVLIVSDHGQVPNSGGQLLLRPWLVHRGYLVPRPRPPARRRFDRIVRGGFELVRRHAGQQMKSRLRSCLPGLQSRAQAGARGVAADWPSTRAWTEGGHIFVNTSGRWPEGCVRAGGERESLLRELRAELLELRDADTGEQAVAAVSLGDDEFTGPEADLMPDLLVHWRHDLRIHRLVDPDGAVIERADAPSVPFGGHHPDGTLIASGPSFRRMRAPQARSIYDVAPTLLHLAGVSVPSHFDGCVMLDRMAPHAAKDVRREVVNVTSDMREAITTTATDDTVVTERLRSLGYLE